ncbi:hypothetical protein [[Bacillus] enclensis]|nr:hypothetical protein [[Bacillus] enclensis]
MTSTEQTVKSDITKNTKNFLTYPVEGSKDEFTTLYTYFSLSFLDIAPGQKVCEHFSSELSKDEFIQTEETFYTGIERLYYAMKLIEMCDQNQLPDQTMEHAVNAIKKLYNQTFYEEGYFLSNEFKKYRNEDGYDEVELMHTSMMLELALKTDIDLNKNKTSIVNWLNQFMVGKNDPQFIRQYYKIMKLLNLKASPSILGQNSYESIIQKENYEFNDLLSIESLTYLHKENKITLNREEIQSILQGLSYSHNQFANIQHEYYVLSIYSNLDLIDVYPHKDKLRKQFNRYAYPDGMMPVFSMTTNPYSGYYSMVVALQSAELDDGSAIQLKKFLSDFLSETDVEKLLGTDPFEILSYIHLMKYVDDTYPDSKEAERISKVLKEKLPPQVNPGNIIKTSHIIESLALLEANLKVKDFPANTMEIVNQLGKGNTKLFENSTDFTNLLFINSLAETGKFSKELKEVIPYVKKVKINLSGEVAAYELYQKTLFLKQMGEATNDDLIAEKLIQLHDGNGYKLNDQQHYKNFYATIFLNRLNQILLGKEQIHEQ